LQKVMDSLTQNDFEAAFQQWQEHCDRCIAVKVTISKEMVFKLR
jgi:hypothetical protein